MGFNDFERIEIIRVYKKLLAILHEEMQGIDPKDESQELLYHALANRADEFAKLLIDLES